MEKNEILDFLKGYAAVLKTDIDISEDMPLSYQVSMPGGCIEIYTAQFKCIAYISIDEGGGSSAPIGPAAMTYAKLFVNLINGYVEKCNGKS